ncbi:MAG: hypothetical protein KME13_06900, partial [Myxacorys californica WJT36-NPBG1]|nr:hypothetical protein [Myxacorys californica WJT36-NPBG1]
LSGSIQLAPALIGLASAPVECLALSHLVTVLYSPLFTDKSITFSIFKAYVLAADLVTDARSNPAKLIAQNV